MWKVLIVICTLGNPCNLFEQDPMMYYNTEEECLIVAEEKAIGMMDTFRDFGYYVESQAHSCQYIEFLKST